MTSFSVLRRRLTGARPLLRASATPPARACGRLPTATAGPRSR